MYTKPQIFNLALQKLLLQRQISNADTDGSNEAKVLRTLWDSAFALTLADLDLDSLSSQVTLELLDTNPNDLWDFSYRYPANCINFRRLQSCVRVDDEDTHIPKAIRVNDDGIKCIFTDQENAILEYISSAVSVGVLSASAGICLATRLAKMAAPLIAGKGASNLIKILDEEYKAAKAEAQEQDKNENFNPENPAEQSSWVKARLS